MTTLGTILAVVALTVRAGVPSPSLAWSYPLAQPNNGVFQLLTDEAGGCAFTYGTEPGSLEHTRVVWVDSEGGVTVNLMFEQGGAAIRGVNDRALVFEEMQSYITVADRNGDVSTIPGLGTGTLPFENRYADADGMCFVGIDDAGHAVSINRYRY